MKRFLTLILGLSFLNGFAMEKPSVVVAFEGPIKSQHNNRYCIYAKINGKDVGEISFKKCTDQIDVWEIVDLEVKLRKKGIGRELFKQCIEYAQGNNACALIWKAQSFDTKIDNKKIVKIYKRMTKKLNLLPALTIGATQGPYGLESTAMKLTFNKK
jgi:GNAT superfamily N-acetyltransferase